MHVETGALRRLGELVPGDGSAALVSDPHVAGIHGMDAQLALGRRLQQTHELPHGEEAKSLAALDRLWQELRLDRRGVVVALGGGCTTDAAGFAAATYLRGIDWAPVPTSLVAQVDAAIGGKTAIDLPQGKNLVGAFHWPNRTLIDPALLATLPPEQRLEGMAEVVKTSLLAAEPLEDLPDPELVRRCAAFKSAVCLRDPHDHADRKQLNLGHTFAHALEAAAGYKNLTHGRAVALGLLAALRLSGRDIGRVEELLHAEAGQGRPGRRLGGHAARQEDPGRRAPPRPPRGSGPRLGRPRPGRRRPDRAEPADRAVASRGMRVLVLNGVNLNILGRRDPSLYGGISIAELEGRIYEWGRELELTVQCRQTNMEGEFVKWCHDAYDNTDGMIVNPGAWTHYAWSIHDALEPLKIPIVEVHLSNVDDREEWRRTSVISDLVSTRFVGHGPDGYRLGLQYLKENA